MFKVGCIFVETVDLIPSRISFAAWSKDFFDIRRKSFKRFEIHLGSVSLDLSEVHK